MVTRILYLLCIALMVLFAFVLGMSVNLNFKPSVIDGAKLAVSNFMYLPQASEFREVKLYVSRTKTIHKEVGNVCGEVYAFKNDVPYKYKRFIVQAAKDNKGNYIYSFPLFDFEGEMISEEEFQKIWEQRCAE